MERLNKYLSEAGVCSRREADRLIESGKVTINGHTAVMGEKVEDGDQVAVKGKPVQKSDPQILLAVNKPRGITCTTAAFDKDNIVAYLNYPCRIYPVGRLDKESEGLILMTNQGELVNKILKGSNYHEKEYIVRIDQPVTEEFLKKMRSGVPILDTVTRPCKVTKIDNYRFRIILTQGLNRQIRRMCEALDVRVRDLRRVRIMNIKLGDLKMGSYRMIEGKEKEELMKLLAGSRN